MSDLKCKGDGCLLAFRCRRFTEYVADNSPPFFADAPYKVVEDVLSCVMFIGEENESYGNEGDNEGEVKANEQRGISED